MAVFESENNDTMSDNEVVASDETPRYLFLGSHKPGLTTLPRRLIKENLTYGTMPYSEGNKKLNNNKHKFSPLYFRVFRLRQLVFCT